MTKLKNNINSSSDLVSLCDEQNQNAQSSLKIEKSDWLDSDGAAQLLKISQATLRNMASNGRITYYKLGRSNRYLRHELESLLLKNKRGAINGN